MDYFERNIRILESSDHSISPITTSNLKFKYEGVLKEEEYFSSDEGQVIKIKNELDYKNAPNPQKRQLYFIFGIFGIEEINRVIEKGHDKSMFIIIEPELSFVLSAMQNKDLTILDRDNVMVVAQPLSQLSTILDSIFKTSLVLLTSNVVFYATYYYRMYDSKTYLDAVKVISHSIKYKLFTLGNSIEDSLIGLKHNIQNLRYIKDSLDFSELKNKFKDKPVIIVSAGPSLDKNIKDLNKAKGKALIFAVDTIVDKLLKEHIIPDFIFSIERIDEVYEYFYKNKEYPKQVTLIAPPVIKPQIFKGFGGKIGIPLRDNVHEFRWYNEILNLDNDAFVSMGSSVAHLAFGVAVHLGASPIVLVGQDLAYSDDPNKTHSKGTIYDENKFNMLEEEKFNTPGYYGGEVLTRKIWLDFKNWFEVQIIKLNLNVINATEGGARIEGTKQMDLMEVIQKYCNESLNIDETLNKISTYNIDKTKVYNNLQLEIKKLKNIKDQAYKLKKILSKINLKNVNSEEMLVKELKKMKKVDSLLNLIVTHPLVFHNLQSYIVNMFRKFYRIPDGVSKENVNENLVIQMEFVQVTETVLNSIINTIEEAMKEKIENNDSKHPKERGSIVY